MPKAQTEDEVRAAMEAISRVAEIEVPAGREAETLRSYRSFLQAVAVSRSVEMPPEAEPGALFSLDRPSSRPPRGGGGSQ